ncbi:MAG: hypothetical protein ABIS36_21495 [Chryseolinea sp.]
MKSWTGDMVQKYYPHNVVRVEIKAMRRLNSWLASFAYRINIDSFNFFIGFVIVPGAVLLTINVHCVRIIEVNAAHALRNE